MSSACSPTVLVVDDDADIRDSFVDVLEEAGYDVVTAVDGRDALAKLRSVSAARPCVILLDLMMPGMTGAEFYAEQQKDPALSSIPVVVVSASGNLRAMAEPFGGDYLAKPVRIETMLGVVERHCPH